MNITSLKQSTVIRIFALSTVVSIIITLVVSLGLHNQKNASALSGSQFNAGNIIDDEVFYNQNAMPASEIQTFLTAQMPSCDTQGAKPATEFYRSDITRAQYAALKGWHGPPYTCLKDYKQNTPQMEAASGYCDAIPAGTGVSSAQIFYNIAQACHINPKVLLVLVQKEQSLVLDTWPLDSQYTKATGFACPDTAPCDSSYGGFFYQIYYAARQFQVYKTYPDSYNYVAGQYNNIYYNPNLAACGSSSVYIQNQATAGLYNYTPYQPNAAALNDLYGTGDNCSSHGNRNFWRLFSDWFGSTHTDTVVFNTNKGNELSTGTRLEAGEYIVSPNGLFETVMGYDGNLATYAVKNGTVTKMVWSTGTASNYGAYAKFQGDGNLVIYTAKNVALWGSGTDGTGANKLSLGDDGNIHIFSNSVEKFTSAIKANKGMKSLKGAGLNVGANLIAGDYLSSANGQYVLLMQGDGNLVIYAANGEAIWASDTHGNPGAYTRLQKDGNLVVYSSSGKALWGSNTSTTESYMLKLQNDGNLVLYTSSGIATWGSETSTNVYTLTALTGSSLNTGAKLQPGAYIRSADWRYTLVMQQDGNLVIYSSNAHNPIWGSGTQGNSGAYSIMQGDGNLVIYTANGRAIWGSGTQGNSGATLRLQSDGNLVIYKTGSIALWGSNTPGRF